MELIPSREAYSCAATPELPAFYGTRRFSTVFRRAYNWSQSWARSIQTIAHHVSLPRHNLILSSPLRLGLPSCLYPSGFPTNTVALFLSLILATCPVHLMNLDLNHSNYTRQKGESYKAHHCASFCTPPPPLYPSAVQIFTSLPNLKHHHYFFLH
jgi:hypothetical protein